MPSSGVLLSLTSSAINPSGNAAMDAPIEAMRSIADYAAVEASIEAEEGRAVWRGTRAFAIQLDGLRPDVLDPAQRQALLDYVCAGGVLMLNAPDPALVAGSWLEPYLPVRMIGMRQMRAIEVPGEATPRTFVAWEACTEAMAGQGKIILEDGPTCMPRFGRWAWARWCLPASRPARSMPRMTGPWRSGAAC